MIIADCNVIAYLVIPGNRTADAKRAFDIDPHWTAPALWRSEFLSVLSNYIRVGAFDVQTAGQFMEVAEQIVSVLPQVPSEEVLARSAASGCSSYDCEYVAAALVQQVPLVIEDQKVLAAFPSLARTIEQYLNSAPRA